MLKFFGRNGKVSKCIGQATVSDIVKLFKEIRGTNN